MQGKPLRLNLKFKLQESYNVNMLYVFAVDILHTRDITLMYIPFLCIQM